MSVFLVLVLYLSLSLCVCVCVCVLCTCMERLVPEKKGTIFLTTNERIQESLPEPTLANQFCGPRKVIRLTDEMVLPLYAWMDGWILTNGGSQESDLLSLH